MKKVIVLFLMGVALLVVAKIAYNKYCESNEGACKDSKDIDYEKHGLPIEGMEW
jgi:hypothetical protein